MAVICCFKDLGIRENSTSGGRNRTASLITTQRIPLCRNHLPNFITNFPTTLRSGKVWTLFKGGSLPCHLTLNVLLPPVKTKAEIDVKGIDRDRERDRGYIVRRKAKMSLEFTSFLSGRERQIAVTAEHSFYDPELMSVLLTGSLTF